MPPSTACAGPASGSAKVRAALRGWCNRQHFWFWSRHWGFESSPPSVAGRASWQVSALPARRKFGGSQSVSVGTTYTCRAAHAGVARSKGGAHEEMAGGSRIGGVAGNGGG